MSILDLLFPHRAKRSHLKNLIAVAYSDGELDQNEAHVLANVAHRLGFDDAEVREIIARHADIRFSLPSDNKARIELLWDYVCLVAADGSLEDRELRLLEGFCKRINLRTGVITSLLRRFEEWGRAGLSIDYLQKDFRKLLADDTVFK